jgi:hypothetical protein
MRCCAENCEPALFIDTWAACVQDPCKEEPFVVGPCEALIPAWSFNKKTGQCEGFTYGGCQGTANRFESLGACEKKCNVVPDDCCPPGEKCCDNECIPDNAQTLVACGHPQCSTDTCTPPPCVCPDVYKPVCSTETGKEYSNECEAKCANDDCCLTTGLCPIKEGQAPPECPDACILLFDPVCCEDTGQTFGNSCLACGKCEGNLIPGECPTKCPKVCTEEDDPVCCPDTLEMYSNACNACGKCPGELMKGVCPIREGQAPPECPEICTADFAPVCCPTTNVTFSNECNSCGQCDVKEPGPPKCDCQEDDNLVCNTRTGTTFANECEAVKCSGQAEEDLTPGACPDAPIPDDPCCPEKERPCCCCGTCVPCDQLALCDCFVPDGGNAPSCCPAPKVPYH